MNEIDRIVSRWTDEYRRQAAPLIARLKELLAKGVPIQQAVNMAFAETGFSGKIADELKASLGSAAGSGYGVTLSLDKKLAIGAKLFDIPWTETKMKLSETLHGTDAVMRRNIVDTIENQLKNGTNWVQMSRKLFDGYGFPETIKKADLPKYMDRMVKAAQKATPNDSAALQEVKRLVRIANRNIGKLAQNDAPNRALKAAYRQLAEAADKGSAKALANAIMVAVNERSRYYAERIARTETARAWSEGFYAKHYDDPDVVAVKWRLGSRHPRFDICDLHAKANLYGMGPGVYPKNATPPHPAHPHCTCRLTQVYDGEVDEPKEQVQAGGNAFLRSLDDRQRQDLLGIEGVKAWMRGEPWQGQLRNWLGHADPGAGVRLGGVDFGYDLQRFAYSVDERLIAFRANMAADKINLNIKADQQRHIWGTKEFIAYGKASGFPPSYVTVDTKELIREYAGTAPDDMVGFKRDEKLPRETIRAGKIIGKGWAVDIGEYVDTSRFVIVYSRRGVHVYPEIERE